MKAKLKYIIPIGIVLLSAILAVTIVKTKPEVATVPAEIPRKLIRVMTVEQKPVEMMIHSQGTVTPRTETRLVSQVAGRVISVSPLFAAGGFFEKGDVLLRLEESDYRLAATAARSQVAQAELSYQREVQEAEIARQEWRQLNNTPIPKLVAREPQLKLATAALEAAEAALQQAELNLARTRIRAPFAGRLRSKNADVGQYVTPGSPVATIYAVDYAEVRLPISDAALAYIDMPFSYRGAASPGRGPRVTLKARFAGTDQEWEGYLNRIEGEIDPQSRMIYVVARVENPYGQQQNLSRPPLAVGLFVEADITGKTVADIIEIPRAAIRNGNQVMIVDADERLRFRNIDIAREKNDIAYVSSGLVNGERVCISPLNTVVDGMQVTVIDANGNAATDSGARGVANE